MQEGLATRMYLLGAPEIVAHTRVAGSRDQGDGKHRPGPLLRDTRTYLPCLLLYLSVSIRASGREGLDKALYLRVRASILEDTQSVPRKREYRVL